VFFSFKSGVYRTGAHDLLDAGAILVRTIKKDSG